MTRIAFLVSVAFFMQNLDATIMTTSLPQMAASFETSPVRISSGFSAYLFALAAFIPVSGWMADRFGTRAIFSWAIALFTAASVMCGLSANLLNFTMARILQGIGGAMMVPVGRMAVLRVTRKDQMLRAISILVWPGLLAPVIGPALGGWIASTLGWRWIFFVNVPLGIAGLILSVCWMSAMREARRPFDFYGFMLSAGGLAGLMYGLDLVAHAGASWAVCAGWIGIGGLSSFLAVRHFIKAEFPMLDFSVMRIRTFRVNCMGGSIYRIAINSAPFLLPLMFQLGLGYDSVQSGLLLLALFGGNLAMKPFTTAILQNFGFRNVLMASGLLTSLSFALCALFGAHTPGWAICLVLFFDGLCRSM